MPSPAFAINWCKSHFEKQLEKGIGKYPIAPIKITSGNGSGVDSIGQTISKQSSHPIIWLKKTVGWGVTWLKGPDPSGSSLSGLIVLGVFAEHFGFEVHVNKKDQSKVVSVPTPEHANWAIEDFNQMLVEKNKSEEAIVLRLERTTGIKSTHEFLVDFLNNKIPVSIDVSRTFLHDMNYHLLAALLYRPQFVKSWQRRTKLIMDIVKEAEILYSNDSIILENLKLVLNEIAGRVDRTGNVSPLMAKALAKDPDAIPFAQLLKKELTSDSDMDFIKDIITQASYKIPGEDKKYFTQQLMLIVQSKKDMLGIMESDPQVKVMINSLIAFQSKFDSETLRPWLKFFPRE